MINWCPVCESNSPESQERLRELARLSLARFLNIAREAGVTVTVDQQRDIYDALVTWNPGGVPAEGDWIVHEWTVRAAYVAVFSPDDAAKLISAMDAMPAWDANFHEPRTWNWSAEERIADQLEPLLRDLDEGQ